MLYRGTFINSQFHVHDALSDLVHYKVVQQHNLGDVANSIPRLCTETSSSQQWNNH